MPVKLISMNPDSQLVLLRQLVTDLHPQAEIFPSLVGCHHANQELIWSDRNRFWKHRQTAKHLPPLFPAWVENRCVYPMWQVPQASIVTRGYTERVDYDPLRPLRVSENPVITEQAGFEERRKFV